MRVRLRVRVRVRVRVELRVRVSSSNSPGGTQRRYLELGLELYVHRVRIT